MDGTYLIPPAALSVNSLWRNSMKCALWPTLVASGEGRPILARINCAEDNDDTVCN